MVGRTRNPRRRGAYVMSDAATRPLPATAPLTVASGDDEWPASAPGRAPAASADAVATRLPHVVFRPLRADDVERCFPTSGRAIAEDWLARQARGDLYVAVAEIDGVPVGRRCLDFTYYPHIHVGYCFAASVRPEWRSRGIGAMLEKHTEEVARARGVRAFRCVVAKHNRRSRAWHERLGYRELGDTVARWTELDGREVEHDCWIFERELGPRRS